jgi:hypothetical protein
MRKLQIPRSSSPHNHPMRRKPRRIGTPVSGSGRLGMTILKGVTARLKPSPFTTEFEFDFSAAGSVVLSPGPFMTPVLKPDE